MIDCSIILCTYLAARTFEQPRLSPEEVRVAIHKVLWKSLTLLPALRNRLVEEPHALVAWTPGRNINAQVLSVVRSRVQVTAFSGYCPPGRLSAHRLQA
jgi:hypothetical protein